MIDFETMVSIGRPIEDVFAFVSEPTQFPRWNSAVQRVRASSGETGAPGSTYAMERELRTGRVENGLEVFAREDPHEFGIRTTSGPTPFSYRYRFASHRADTIVHLDATVELQGVPPVLGSLAARAIRRGVDANLASLKRILEGPARDAPSASG